MMSSSTPSQLTIPVRDDSTNIAPPPVSSDDHQQTSQGHNIIGRAKGLYDSLTTNCVSRLPFTHLVMEKTDEGKAYERLLVDLEDAKKGKRRHIVYTIIFLVIFALICTFTIIKKKWHLLNKEIKSWLTLLMVLVCGYHFFLFVTSVILESFNRVLKLDRYVLFYTKQMRQCVVVTLWFLLVLWVWYTFFRFDIVKDTRGAHVLHTSKREYQRVLKIVVKQITRLMMAITIGALLWTLKSALFLYLKANLYYKELCQRIRQSILDLHAIQYIEMAGRWEFIPSRRTRGDAPRADAWSGVSFWMNVSMLNEHKTPFWIIKRLADVYLENMNRENKPRILREIEGINDDKKLMDEAKKMLDGVKEGRPLVDDDSDITPDDLEKYDLTRREIFHVFELFERNPYGKEIRRETWPNDGEVEDKLRTARITRDQFLRWTLLALKNCLGLELTLNNSDNIFWKLEVLMDVCVVGLTTIIWLLLSEIVKTGQLAILLSPIFTAGFIYSDSMKETFGGITFVFGMHPFDVGERVKIDDVEMKVTKINILTTVFIEYNSGVEVIYPNSELARKKIVNLDITPDQPDSIEFTVPIDTPQEFIRDLQLKIKKTLDDDLTFTSETTVAKKQITKEEVTLIVHFKYLVSYLSAETKAQHRSRILGKIMRFCDEMTRKEEKASPKEEADILRLKINANMKLPAIEELKNEIKQICGTLKDKGRLIEYSPVLFAGICKENISMDVRMKYPKTVHKDLLKEYIQNAVDKAQTGSRKRDEEIEKDEPAAFWLSKPDWDDDKLIDM